MKFNNPYQQKNWHKRINNYHLIRQELDKLNEDELLERFLKIDSHLSSLSVNTLMQVSEQTVFIKAIYLSELECLPENYFSTTNFFQLPLYYQYGIGSLGFGAWRELSAQQIASNWVLSGQCNHFPLLYQWRTINIPSHTITSTILDKVEKEVSVWHKEPTICYRHLARHKGQQVLLLFLEYIPFTLHDWLLSIKKDALLSTTLLQEIDNSLTDILTFINKQGMQHFDAHFKNILTDGQQVYLSDFGLAISDHFKLSESEKVFFKRHQNYDQMYKAFFLVYWLIEYLLKLEINSDKDFSILLQKYYQEKSSVTLPAYLKPFEHYLPIALRMDKFYRTLRENLESTAYPLSE
ncbi:serine/threonine-protein kinase [Legionella gresilensis]|uniref:serine/threonine-protein kinase n=1 Tax=Legionella gresilensis TaxID=91823 RepID=UPI001041B250|nr:serine/threonine-protein kinase [Legionella gresilensis]